MARLRCRQLPKSRCFNGNLTKKPGSTFSKEWPLSSSLVRLVRAAHSSGMQSIPTCQLSLLCSPVILNSSNCSHHAPLSERTAQQPVCTGTLSLACLCFGTELHRVSCTSGIYAAVTRQLWQTFISVRNAANCMIVTPRQR